MNRRVSVGCQVGYSTQTNMPNSSANSKYRCGGSQRQNFIALKPRRWANSISRRQTASPGFGAGQRRRVAPIQQAANLQRPAVQPQLRAERLDSAKAHAGANPVAVLTAQDNLQLIEIRLSGRPGAGIRQLGGRLESDLARTSSVAAARSNPPRRAADSGWPAIVWPPAVRRKEEYRVESHLS